MRKIPRPPGRQEQRLQTRAESAPTEKSDDQYPSFRFTRSDPNKHCLRDWRRTELEQLIKAFSKYEGYTWLQLKTTGSKKLGESAGPGYKPIERKSLKVKLPSSIPEDATITELRVDTQKRLFGYREGAVFYLIWFDREHAVCD